MKFSIKVGGGKANFLDLGISIQDCEYKYDIYRKPTTTNVTIHWSSICPLPHKIASSHYFINRLVSAPLTVQVQAFNSEVGVIKYLAWRNKVNMLMLMK